MTRIGNTPSTVVDHDANTEHPASTAASSSVHASVTTTPLANPGMAPLGAVARGDYAPGSAATNPATLQKQVATVMVRAVAVDLPASLQTNTIQLDQAFIAQVNTRYADLGEKPIEVAAARALGEIGHAHEGSYAAFIATLDRMMAKKRDLAAAVMARSDVREHLLLAWFQAGPQRRLVETLAKFTTAIAAPVPLAL